MPVKRYTTIAEFQGGPYDGQRREMRYLQTEWHPADEAGYYRRCDLTGKPHRQHLVYTADEKAIVWEWILDGVDMRGVL